MSIRNELLKAAGLYVLGRLTANITADDISKITRVSMDDVRRYGLNGTDALLGAIGVRRKSSVPSFTALVLAGFAAGAVVGTGVTFLFYSSQGKEVRRKIVEYFGKGTDEASTNRQESGARA